MATQTWEEWLASDDSAEFRALEADRDAKQREFDDAHFELRQYREVLDENCEPDAATKARYVRLAVKREALEAAHSAIDAWHAARPTMFDGE